MKVGARSVCTTLASSGVFHVAGGAIGGLTSSSDQ